jgi:hypothetical protein
VTNQDIIRMAKEAGWLHEYDSPTGFVAEAAFKFAELVAAAEREEIIATANSATFSRIRGEFSPTSQDLVQAIRARCNHAP